MPGCVATINKNGRMLNLLETHALVCDVDHRITYCHDSVADVILTICIFNYSVSRITPIIAPYKWCTKYKKN